MSPEVEHELVGGDLHISHIRFLGDRCMCFGPCCYNEDVRGCVCEECECPKSTNPKESVDDSEY